MRNLSDVKREFALAASVFFLASLVAGAARAEQPSAQFPAGTWEVEGYGSYVQPIRFSEDRFSLGTVGVAYYPLNNFSLGVSISGYHVNRVIDEDALGVGLDGMIRWHLIDIGRFTFYADGGGGVWYGDTEVPEFGTQFNFTGKVGLGVTWRIQDRLHVMLGARYFHLSNGNLHGRDQNPSFDGVQYYAGLMYTF